MTAREDAAHRRAVWRIRLAMALHVVGLALLFGGMCAMVMLADRA